MSKSSVRLTGEERVHLNKDRKKTSSSSSSCSRALLRFRASPQDCCATIRSSCSLNSFPLVCFVSLLVQLVISYLPPGTISGVEEKVLDSLITQSVRLADMDQSLPNHANHQKGDYILIRDVEHGQLGLFDKPLPCCGCGIGWFSFLLGFIFPFMWYYGTILYFGNYYQKDPRERAGLAANAIA